MEKNAVPVPSSKAWLVKNPSCVGKALAAVVHEKIGAHLASNSSCWLILPAAVTPAIARSSTTMASQLSLLLCICFGLSTSGIALINTIAVLTPSSTRASASRTMGL